LKKKHLEIREVDDKVFAVSRSIHYGLFLAFEGIRFFVRKENGQALLYFANLNHNLERFRRSMAFNLSGGQQSLLPETRELANMIRDFFAHPSMQPFIEEMAQMGCQGYLRPFTCDEAMSIGVTFPEDPAIRLVACRYDRYLGEPFTGVVIPHLVRAVTANKTGCLKLGVNYLVSVKAVDAARAIEAEASAALFLDDRPDLPITERTVSEWDSSCCLFALADGSIIKIPEHPLILPSVTIQGICSILRSWGVKVIERHLKYGELLAKHEKNELVTICSIGTAGILNRADRLVLLDSEGKPCGEHRADKSHPLYTKLGEARQYYWDIYRGLVPTVPGIKLQSMSAE